MDAATPHSLASLSPAARALGYAGLLPQIICIALILMGHGTHHPANIYYPGLQYSLDRLDPLILIGTVEGTPSLEDVRRVLATHKVAKVYLQPFMAVSGDHAMNDMAGDEEDSWKSVLTRDGLTCVPILRGTAESPVFVEIWLDHLQTALDRLP